LSLIPGTWHRILLEFAGEWLGGQLDGRAHAEIPVGSWPESRHAGFALVSEAGAVAVKDVWMTPGILPPNSTREGASGGSGKSGRPRMEK
jgi:hypothetical protein